LAIDDSQGKSCSLKGGRFVRCRTAAIFLRNGVNGKSASIWRASCSRAAVRCRAVRRKRARRVRNAGMGQAKYAQLQAVLELARRALREKSAAGRA